MHIKEKDGKKTLISTVKVIKIKITQKTLSKALKILNEDNELFFPSWFHEAKTNRPTLILEMNKPGYPFTPTYLLDLRNFTTWFATL
jgi:hypothetical protein